jgi:formylglycine-generating enzyme required for sulfatase activity
MGGAAIMAFLPRKRAGALLLGLLVSSCGGRPVSGILDEGDLARRDVRVATSDGGPGELPDPGGWESLPAGSFLMGSPATELCRLDNETLHSVTLTRMFSIATTEVTRASFTSLMGYDPSQAAGCARADCPADSATWHEAVVYCNKLSEQAGLEKCYACVADHREGLLFPYDCSVRPEFDVASKSSIYHCPGFRLPTEAEWEYACRAGSSTAFYNGPIASCDKDGKADAISWYRQNSGDAPHAVGGKQPNASGLHDMAGNLMEWVNDPYVAELGAGAVVDPVGGAGPSRVVRGGSFRAGSWSARAASRNHNQPANAESQIGFRCVRTLPAK